MFCEKELLLPKDEDSVVAGAMHLFHVRAISFTVAQPSTLGTRRRLGREKHTKLIFIPKRTVKKRYN